MKRLFILPFLLLLLLIVPIAAAQVTVERDLPEKIYAGEDFTVTLTLKVGENKPNGVIVVEKVPEGFTYVSSDPEGVFMENTNELKWVFYGDDVKDRTITYTLKAPSELKTVTFYGEVKTILGTEEIKGNNKASVVSKPSPTPTPAAGKMEKGPGFELSLVIISILLILALKRRR